MSALATALGMPRGIVCAVGAGGKKSLLYHLAAALPGRIGLTATVQMAVFPADLDAARIVATSPELEQSVPAAAATSRIVAYARSSPKPDRLAGVPPELVEKLHERAEFDVTLVKADGARMRLMKAPKPDEPVLPTTTSMVVPIVSARVIGQPLSDKIAHRIDRISAVTDLQAGDIVGPDHLARLLTNPAGALQGAGQVPLVPVINMVDTPELAQKAREAARAALQSTRRFDRVVLTSLRASPPQVQVISQ